jgi:3'(2'), 5'-bisphosphate nucleotidase
MKNNLSEQKLTELLEIAKDAAIQASGVILKYFKNDDLEVTRKQDKSPVTIADREANKIILSELKKTSIPILSEENKKQPYDTRKSWDTCWIVDPLDGTKEFIKGLKEYTVNIALVKDGKPQLGVVLAPALGDLFFGIVGKGAWQESGDKKQTLKVSKSAQISKATVSRSHLSDETRAFLEKIKPKPEVISAGSSLKFMQIATGEAEIYPRYTPSMEWDTAAAHAIVNAAGGKVLQWLDQNQELIYNKKDLTNPAFIAVCRENLLESFKPK